MNTNTITKQRPFQNLSSAYLTSQISILSRFINTEGVGSYIADESFTEEYRRLILDYEAELNRRENI